MLSRKLCISLLFVACCCCCSLQAVVASAAPVQQQQQQQQQSHSHSQTMSRRTSRQRRAMNNRGRNNDQRRHRYNNYESYTQQQEKGQTRYYKTRQTEASLADVWLCYAFALGWSAWFLSSFLNTDLMRFAESESVLVHGNVREVSIEDDSLGTGIPTYHALIDYIITVRRAADSIRIQVRKSFQTQHLLQQGFANVELLVLPEEPTSSVLKEDWQREVAAQELAEEDIISIGGAATVGTGIAGMVGISEHSTIPTLTRVDVWVKRTSLVLSGTLVTASLIGAVQAVHRLKTERLQFYGWVSVVLGSVLLWPLAMFSLRIVSICQRLGQLPTEKSGIILKCDTNAQAGVDTEEKVYTQHYDKDATHANTTTRHLNNVSHPDTFDKLKTPQHRHSSNHSSEQQLQQPNDDAAASNASADESACYFVKLPSDGKKDGNGLGTVRLVDDSSLSTISADSRLSKTKRSSGATT